MGGRGGRGGKQGACRAAVRVGRSAAALPASATGGASRRQSGWGSARRRSRACASRGARTAPPAPPPQQRQRGLSEEEEGGEGVVEKKEEGLLLLYCTSPQCPPANTLTWLALPLNAKRSTAMRPASGPRALPPKSAMSACVGGGGRTGAQQQLGTPASLPPPQVQVAHRTAPIPSFRATRGSLPGAPRTGTRPAGRVRRASPSPSSDGGGEGGAGRQGACK